MLKGKDNYYASSANRDDEPGNQLGGLDFNLLLLKNKNLVLFGQITGEDEAGYLPSKTFYLLGASYSWNKFNPRKINFEYSDTGSREANVTYNHFIFKDGYRYYGIPIGSTYDADSKTKSISYHHQFNNNLNFNLRAVHGSLNYHSSNTFFIRGFLMTLL